MKNKANKNFSVIYEFEVIKDKEDEFIKGWSGLTDLIYQYENSFGSRLHHVNDQLYIAYAVWPDKNTWFNAGDRLPKKAEYFKTLMKSSTKTSRTINELDIKIDKIKNNQYNMENRVLSVGSKFPSFDKKAVVSTENGKEFENISSDSLFNNGNKWTVMFWWPKDFTFVCPTEITAFNDVYNDFESLNSQLLGASTDSEFVHLAWRESHPGLKKLKFPMLADTSKSLAEELGILEPNEKVAYRATFIIDPSGVIKWLSVNDLNIGRNVKEVLRVLEALQTGDLTPCNWESGDETLK